MYKPTHNKFRYRTKLKIISTFISKKLIYLGNYLIDSQTDEFIEDDKRTISTDFITLKNYEERKITSFLLLRDF